jgi:hypothetical protein
MILLNGNTILASKRLSAKSTINRKRLYLHSDLGSYAIQNFGDFTVPYGGKDLVVKYLGVFSQSANAQNLLSSYFKLPNLKGNLVNITNQLSFFANDQFKNSALYGATDEGTFFILLSEGIKDVTFIFYQKGCPKIHHVFGIRDGEDDSIISMLNQSADIVEDYLSKALAYFAYRYTSSSLNYDRYDVETGKETLDVRPTDAEIEEGVKFISPLMWKGPKTRYYPQTQI